MQILLNSPLTGTNGDTQSTLRFRAMIIWGFVVGALFLFLPRLAFASGDPSFVQFVEPLVQASSNSSPQYLAIRLSASTDAERVAYVYPTMGADGSRSGLIGPGSYRVSFLMKVQSLPSRISLHWTPKDPLAARFRNAVVFSSASMIPGQWASIETRVNFAEANEGWFALRIAYPGSATEQQIVLDQFTVTNIPLGTSVLPDGALTFDTTKLLQAPSSDQVRVSATGASALTVIRQNLSWQYVPKWFRDERTHFHTRFSSPQFTANRNGRYWQVANRVHNLGANVFTRHIKSYPNSALWPTAIPDTSLRWRDRALLGFPSWAQDLAQEFVNTAHAANTRVILYYAKETDNAIAGAHHEYLAEEPDDLSKNEDEDLEFKADGSLARIDSDDTVPYRVDDIPNGPTKYIYPFKNNSRYPQLSLNSPYRDVLLGRILELAQRGADGVYSDFIHGPQNGSWAPGDLQKFQEFFPGSIPQRKDYSDLRYRNLLKTYDLTNQSVFSEIQESAHAINPEMVFPISISRFPRLWDVRWSSRFLDVIQSPKVEWSRFHLDRKWFFTKLVRDVAEGDRPSPFVYQVFAAAAVRDFAHGRPAHVWIYDPGSVNVKFLPPPPSGTSARDHRFFESEKQVLAVAGALHSFGFIANFDFMETSEDYDYQYLKAFRRGHLIGTATSEAKTVYDVGFLFSESYRDSIYNSFASDMNGHDAYWKNLAAPLFHSFGMLLSEGYSVGVVTDTHLVNGDATPFKVLIVPSQQSLTVLPTAAQQSLTRFLSAGGIVVPLDQLSPNSPWWNSANHETLRSTLLAAVRPGLATAIRVQAPSTRPDVSFTVYEKALNANRSERVYVLGNDATWMYQMCADIPGKVSKITPRPGMTGFDQLIYDQKVSALHTEYETCLLAKKDYSPPRARLRLRVPNFDPATQKVWFRADDEVNFQELDARDLQTTAGLLLPLFDQSSVLRITGIRP